MEVLTAILVGFGTGIFITWFPGMLNLQVVATAVRVGQRRAVIFSAGMAAVILAQSILAVLFANLLSDHPDFVAGLKFWAVPLFVFLCVGFTYKGFTARAARKAEVVRPYKGGPFWRGVMMSSMNVLNIPFIGALASFLITSGYLSRAYLPRLVYVPATALGAFFIFFLYARLSDWISEHMAFFTRNINFFLGGLFAILAVVQTLRIY